MIALHRPVGQFACNCHLLACPKTGEALLVDPGDDAAEIAKMVASAKLPDGRPVQVKYLLHTHGHLDHIGATRALKEGSLSQSRIALHRDDEPLYMQLRMQGRLFGMEFEDPLPVEKFLEHEEELRLGTLRFTVIHSPGHSPGSIGLRLHEDSEAGTRETLFSGDTLFQGSVGRTDLWGADQELMFKMIRSRFLTLDGDTRVCPGHGPDTTIAREARENPFLA